MSRSRFPFDYINWNRETHYLAVKKMKDVKMKQYDETDNDEYGGVEGRIPALSIADKQWSENHDNKAWAHEILAQWELGETGSITNAGVTLQKTSESSMRCISIFDHPSCFRLLGMMWRTFKSGILLIDPFAVVASSTSRRLWKGWTSWHWRWSDEGDRT